MTIGTCCVSLLPPCRSKPKKAPRLQIDVIGQPQEPTLGISRRWSSMAYETNESESGTLDLTQDSVVDVFEFPNAPPNYEIKSGLVSNWLTLLHDKAVGRQNTVGKISAVRPPVLL
jgi:hypothetical protein